MFAYIKTPPTTYVLHYRNGRVRREGPGLAFWYFQPASTIVAMCRSPAATCRSPSTRSPPTSSR